VLCPLKAVLLRVPLQAQDGVPLGLNSADVHLQRWFELTDDTVIHL
jgi:hypothetical protein